MTKKPRKPENVDDIWDMLTYRADLIDLETVLNREIDEIRDSIAELQTRLADLLSHKKTVIEWLNSHQSIADDYMDYDESLDTLLKMFKDGKLERKQFYKKLHDGDGQTAFMYTGDGRFDLIKIRKAVISSGGVLSVGLADNTQTCGLVWIQNEIAEWIFQNAE